MNTRLNLRVPPRCQLEAQNRGGGGGPCQVTQLSMCGRRSSPWPEPALHTGRSRWGSSRLVWPEGGDGQGWGWRRGAVRPGSPRPAASSVRLLPAGRPEAGCPRASGSSLQAGNTALPCKVAASLRAVWHPALRERPRAAGPGSGVTGGPQRYIQLRTAGARGAGTASPADVVLCVRMGLVLG